MTEDPIPGVIPAPPEAPKPKTLTFKGKTHHFVCEVGKPLSFDTIGQVPKKVLKKAEKMWRRLNPRRDEMSTEGATVRALTYITCRYHLGVLLCPWLTGLSKREIA